MIYEFIIRDFHLCVKIISQDDSCSENVERINIDANAAFKAFKGKTVATGQTGNKIFRILCLVFI